VGKALVVGAEDESHRRAHLAVGIAAKPFGDLVDLSKANQPGGLTDSVSMRMMASRNWAQLCWSACASPTDIAPPITLNASAPQSPALAMPQSPMKRPIRIT
jgi:hypothetical protein